jgi:hypothetical protein
VSQYLACTIPIPTEGTVPVAGTKRSTVGGVIHLSGISVVGAAGTILMMGSILAPKLGISRDAVTSRLGRHRTLGATGLPEVI